MSGQRPFGDVKDVIFEIEKKGGSESVCFLSSSRMQYAPSMSAGIVTLAASQFFGERFRTVRTHSFACAEGEATGSARELPRHSHASSHFVLVVRGAYITEARNQDRMYGPGTLIYNPTGTTHRDRFHNGCGRFLTITPSPDVARLLDTCVPVSLVIHDGEAMAAASRIRRQMFEQHSPRLLPELVEACSLDLAATIAASFETEGRHVPSWLITARQMMRDCCTGGITIGAVAHCLGIHSVHLARAFRRYFHISPSEYVSRCQIGRAQELLVSSKLALAEIAIEVGFSDQSHLTNAFRRVTAMTPAAYRRASRRV
jgi:AraC family transcriptional regulator